MRLVVKVQKGSGMASIAARAALVVCQESRAASRFVQPEPRRSAASLTGILDHPAHGSEQNESQHAVQTGG